MRIVDIPGYDGYFKISEDGRVFRADPKTGATKWEYKKRFQRGTWIVSLWIPKKYGKKRCQIVTPVHILLWESFTNSKAGFSVGFKDGDKNNLHIDNLFYKKTRESFKNDIKNLVSEGLNAEQISARLEIPQKRVLSMLYQLKLPTGLSLVYQRRADLKEFFRNYGK